MERSRPEPLSPSPTPAGQTGSRTEWKRLKSPRAPGEMGPSRVLCSHCHDVGQQGSLPIPQDTHPQAPSHPPVHLPLAFPPQF